MSNQYSLDIKQLVSDWEYSTLEKVHYCYAIKGTFNILTDQVNSGERLTNDLKDVVTPRLIAESVIAFFVDFEEEGNLGLGYGDVQKIAALIESWYKEEFDALKTLVESRQRDNWAYLTRKI